MSKPAWINVGGQDSVGSATVTASTDTLTVAGHSLVDGDIVMVDTLTGGAVGPLIPGAVYFVRNVVGDTFQLSGTRGSQLKEFATNGTAEVYVAVPQYHAQDLRLNDTVTLFHGSGDGLGAREGIRPGSGPVITLAGTTWTVTNHSGVVYPALTSTSGPYRYYQIQTSDSLNPADGGNPRVDALDLLVEDDDEDASGFRRSRVVYVAGTPAGSPSAPAVTPNALRLGTILVPAGGSPAPSVQSLAQFTVSSGGILPVLTAATLPAAGRYTGMYADQADIGALRRWNGLSWETVASTLIQEGAAVSLGTFNGGSGTNVTTIFSGIDQSFRHLMLIWRGSNDSAAAAATCSMRLNGDAGSNYFSELARTQRTVWAHLATANTTSIRVGFTGNSNGTHGMIYIPQYSAAGFTKAAHGTSLARGVDGSSTNNSFGLGGGYWTSTAAITSIQLWPAGQLWDGNVIATLLGIR